jgi:hypothetical protein
MRAWLQSHKRRRFRVVTTDSRTAVAPNVLERDFGRRHRTRVAGGYDLLPTQEGWLALALVLDLYARWLAGR